MKFADVVGHAEIKDKLRKSVAEGRISHAQLFLGYEGSGNLPLARAYAQYVLCTNRNEIDSCGVCSSCQMISKMAHPDVHYAFPVVTPAGKNEPSLSDDFMDQFRNIMLAEPYSNYSDWVEYAFKEGKNAIINVRQADEIARKLRLKAYEGMFKFMIIWLPERMNAQTGNKLLKLIEEPPPQTVLLLVSDNDDQILSTILSRTQLVKLKKISDFDMMEGLLSRYRLSMDRAREIVNISDGNFTQALTLAEYDENHEKHFEMFVTWMRACFTLDITQLMALGDELHNASKDKQKSFFMYSMHMMREALMNNFDTMLMRVTENERNFLIKFSAFVHEKNIERIAYLLEKAVYFIDRNASVKIMFMDISLQFQELLKDKSAFAV